MNRFLALVGLCFAFTLTLSVPGMRADTPVRVLENRHTAHFADRLTFRLVAEADGPIQRATLYYRRQNERLVNRVVPEITPGRHVEATFEKTLERGEIPSGTTLEYYWQLDLANGANYDTPRQTFVYEDDRFSWQKVHADNLSVLYYGNERDAGLAQELLQRGLSTLVRLQGEIGVKLESPVRVYVYHNTRDMAAALSPRSAGFDERVTTLGVAVSDDTLLLLGNQSTVQQTLSHELSHIVVGLATKNPYSPLPRWLDEGLAMYAEGELPAGNAKALKSAVSRDALISIRSLSSYTGDPTQVDLFYGEVHSLVDFLVRTFGRDKISALLQAFKQGITQEDALQRVYNLTIDELEIQWRSSLGLQPRSAAAPIAATAAPASRSGSRSQQPCPAVGLAILGSFCGLAYRRAWIH